MLWSRSPETNLAQLCLNISTYYLIFVAIYLFRSSISLINVEYCCFFWIDITNPSSFTSHWSIFNRPMTLTISVPTMSSQKIWAVYVIYLSWFNTNFTRHWMPQLLCWRLVEPFFYFIGIIKKFHILRFFCFFCNISLFHLSLRLTLSFSFYDSWFGPFRKSFLSCINFSVVLFVIAAVLTFLCVLI